MGGDQAVASEPGVGFDLYRSTTGGGSLFVDGTS